MILSINYGAARLGQWQADILVGKTHTITKWTHIIIDHFLQLLKFAAVGCWAERVKKIIIEACNYT